MPVRKLRVFLCHSSNDKPAVRELYQRLESEGWINPWLDEEKLYPGQDWDLEIEKAVEAADAVVVFLSNNSVTKEGYIQRELRFVLRIADFKPDGTVFVIPLRLEDCPAPRRLSMWQYVDYFPDNRKDWAYQRLLSSLRVRAKKLSIPTTISIAEKDKQKKEFDKVIQIVNGLEAKRKRENDKKVKSEKEKLEKAVAELQREISSPIEASRNIERSVQSYDTKKGFKRYGVIGFILVGLIGLIYSGNYIYSNIPTPTETTLTEQIIISTNTHLVTSTPETSQLIQTPSSTFYTAPFKAISTPRAISTMISPKDGMVMVYVPSGEFLMGSEDGDDDEKPVHTVYLDAFWIDQTEVTNAMYAKCTQAGKCSLPSSTKSNTHYSYFGNSDFYDYPVIYVSWNDANVYCEWANRRLLKEAEWEKAARGEHAFTYPWGNDVPSVNLLNYNNAVGDTTKVDVYPSGASIYGVLDMSGNVWEWINDWYSRDYYSTSPLSNPSGPDWGLYRVLKGGPWYGNDFDVRSANRSWINPSVANFITGFRCALSTSD